MKKIKRQHIFLKVIIKIFHTFDEILDSLLRMSKHLMHNVDGENDEYLRHLGHFWRSVSFNTIVNGSILPKKKS